MTGHPLPYRQAPRHARGFTLLELLVVVVIIGIVLGVVAVNATPNPRSQLNDDAQKMARLIELGQEEAQLTSRPVAWEGDRKSTRLNSSHIQKSRMPSSA